MASNLARRSLAILLLGLLISSPPVAAGRRTLRQEESREAELASKLIAAKTEEERAALLETNKELLTQKLCEVLLNRGRSLNDQSNFPVALIAYQAARTIAERIGERKSVISALVGMGQVYQGRGDFPLALDVFQQAQKLAETSGESALLVTVQNSLCQVEQRLGNFDRAKEHCQQALTLSETSGNRVQAAIAFNSLGVLARQRGQYEQALEFYHKSLALEEALGNKRNIARLLNNLGVANNAMGNQTAALRYYLQSLPIAEEIGNKAGMASTLNNIGMIYRGLGNYKLGLEYSQRSHALSEEIGDKVTLNYALDSIGKNYAQAGNYAEALSYYRRSLALAEQTGQKLEIAIRLLSVGNGYSNVGDDEQAMEHYQRGLALAESIGVPYTSIAFLIRLSQLHFLRGKNAEALDYAERAIAQVKQIGTHKDYWHALMLAGAAQRRLKRPAEARQRLEESINAVEEARSQLAAGEQEQAFFFNYRLDPYIQMVMLLADQGQTAEAFTFAERAKSRVLLDVLQSGRVDINKALSQPEREQQHKLRGELTALNGQLRRESQSTRRDPVRVEELKAKLEKARLMYEKFQTQLYAAHPELRVKRGLAQTATPAQAGELLTDAQTALLEYVVADERAFLLVLTALQQKGETKPLLKLYHLNINRADLARQVGLLRQRIANHDLEYRALSGELYNLLIAPAKAQLQGKTRLVIVPDDVLWETPFQALQSANGRFLIQDAAISYAPSLTVLREIVKSRRSRAAQGLLAMGNPKLADQTGARSKDALMSNSLEPLPETERLVKRLAQMYGAQASKLYVGADAREEILKAESGNYRVLQLATHGVLNNASPMYSHLVLAQSEGAREDGLLEAWEIMQMDLQAELAVMSACETARGQVGAGEGVIGVSWALFVAGCPTTVVSQWKVESASTTELILGFHRQLQAGTAKNEALRQSALRLMKDEKFNHPFYWAGFVMVGDGG